MKRILYLLLLIGSLTGCSSYQLPPFAGDGKWFLRDYSAVNVVDSMKIDFSGKNRTIIANASNGDYDLNFIVSKQEFDSYNPAWTKYLKDIVKSIPLKVNAVEFIMADQFLALSIDKISNLAPDYVRRADGAWFVAQANLIENTVQPADEIWRNLLFDKGKRQILVVDRIIRNGKNYAIVYVMQSEKKGIPFATPFHYDILDPHNMQSVGVHLEYLLTISIDAQTSSLN